MAAIEYVCALKIDLRVFKYLKNKKIFNIYSN